MNMFKSAVGTKSIKASGRTAAVAKPVALLDVFKRSKAPVPVLPPKTAKVAKVRNNE
jgi:hypothetical protein